MTRGPDSEQAVAWAKDRAELQGDVYLFRKNRDRPCDFLIVNDRRIIFVAVKRTRSLYRPVEDLGAEYQEAVLRLRMVKNPSVERQLWLFSRRGKYRTFRVTATGIEETLDRADTTGGAGLADPVSPADRAGSGEAPAGTEISP